MGKGIGQNMDYKIDLVHNVPTAGQNAIVSIASKFKDNIWDVKVAPVILL